MKRLLAFLACFVEISLILGSQKNSVALGNTWLFENSDKLELNENESKLDIINSNKNNAEENAKIVKFKNYISEFYKKNYSEELIKSKLIGVTEELYSRLKKFVEKYENGDLTNVENFADDINNFLFANKSVKLIKFKDSFDNLNSNIKKLHACFKSVETYEKFLENNLNSTFESPIGHGIFATDDDETALKFTTNENMLTNDQKNFKNFNSYEKSKKPFNGLVSVAFDPTKTKIINYENIQKIKLIMLYLHPDMFDAYKIFDGRYGFDSTNCRFNEFYSKKEQLKSLAFFSVFKTKLTDVLASIDPNHKLSDSDYKKKCYEYLIDAFKNQNFIRKYNNLLENISTKNIYTNYTFTAFNDVGLLAKLLDADAVVLKRKIGDDEICKYNFVNPKVLIVCGNENNKNDDLMLQKILDDQQNEKQQDNELFDFLYGKSKKTSNSKNTNKNNETTSSKSIFDGIDDFVEFCQTNFKTDYVCGKKKKYDDLTEEIRKLDDDRIKKEKDFNQILQELNDSCTTSNFSSSDLFNSSDDGNDILNNNYNNYNYYSNYDDCDFDSVFSTNNSYSFDFYD